MKKKTKFELWLEFEEWVYEESNNPEDDFFNMTIKLADGTTYSLIVWTFKFIDRTRQDYRDTGEVLMGRYLVAPDLLVDRLDRGLLEAIVARMIEKGGLNEKWIVKDNVS